MPTDQPPEDPRRFLVRKSPDGSRWLIWDQERQREHPTDLQGEKLIRAFAAALNDYAAQRLRKALG